MFSQFDFFIRGIYYTLMIHVNLCRSNSRQKLRHWIAIITSLLWIVPFALADTCPTLVNAGDLSNCKRERDSRLPSSGLHAAGKDFARTAPTGTSYHRLIIQWYQAYKDGVLNTDWLDHYFDEANRYGMKVILSLRANHPQKSSTTFDPSAAEKTYQTPDSLPHDLNEWTSYVKQIVQRYSDEGLIAVAVLNELPQFEKNKILPERKKDLLTMMKATYETIKAVNPRMIVISPATTGGHMLALKEGFNERGWIYVGNDTKGYQQLTQADAKKLYAKRKPRESESEIGLFETVVIDGAPYYDFLDTHLRSDFAEDPRFVANFIRHLWQVNGIQGKGLMALEFGGPFHPYSEEAQVYMIRAAQMVAYSAGFDAITWAPWYIEKKQALKYQRNALVDQNNRLKPDLVEAFKTLVTETKNFTMVKRLDLQNFVFTLPDGSKHKVMI